VFITSPDFRSRLLKKGWEDVTGMFDGEAVPEAPPGPPKGDAPKAETGKRRTPPARGVVARVEG
jgi:hypothetical protein